MLRIAVKRQRRRLHRVGKGQRPVDAAVARCRCQRRHLRAVEADADRLAFLQRQAADVARRWRRPCRGSVRYRSDWSDRTPATRYRRGETALPASWWQRKISHAGRRCRARARPKPLVAGRRFGRGKSADAFGISGFGAAAAACIASTGVARSVLPPAANVLEPVAGMAPPGIGVSGCGWPFSADGAACSAWLRASRRSARASPVGRRWLVRRWLSDVADDRRQLLRRHRWRWPACHATGSAIAGLTGAAACLAQSAGGVAAPWPLPLRPAFPPAGRRHRRCSSFPRGTSARRLRRSA